jgi:transcriptional regulator with XRE-family HTH domain
MPRYRQQYIGGVRPETVLYRLRKLCGLSQTELGTRCGTNQTAISDYENGLAIPEQHAKRIYSVLLALMPPEYAHVVRALSPSSLPEPWESVLNSLDVKEQYDGNHDYTPINPLVVG